MDMMGMAGGPSRSPTMLGTVAGQIMGTAGYMAPEQVDGSDIDHRADLFAFGCVLYEMATGRRAFSGKNLPETMHQLANVDPVPMTPTVSTTDGARYLAATAPARPVRKLVR